MVRQLQYARKAIRSVRLLRNWPTAFRNKHGLAEPGTEVIYRLRTGHEFAMESGFIDLQILYELLGERIYEPTGDFRIKNGWTVIDLGAHKGVFSTHAALSGPETVVHAVEPDPKNFEYLNRNIALNNISGIQAYNAAIWTEPGVKEFRFDTSWSHALMDVSVLDRDDTNTTLVPTMTLDEIIALAGGSIDLLKIDIEGAEHAVLHRVHRETLGRVQRIVLEYHAVRNMTADAVGSDLIRLLHDFGFDCSPIPNLKDHLYAIARSADA